MNANFLTVLRKFTLPYEGGKVDNKKDPGGRTNQGVTQATFTSYLKRNGKASRDVYTMTDAERDDIYRYQYWNTVRGDDLPAGVDGAVFDAGVMSGPSRGIKWLQSALAYLGFYKGKVDGLVGVQTLDAARTADAVKTVQRVCANRLGFVRSLVTLFKTFGKGWTSRITACEAFCVKLALTSSAAIATGAGAGGSIEAGQATLPGIPEKPATAAPSPVSEALQNEASSAEAAAGREAKKSTAAAGGGAASGGTGAVASDPGLSDAGYDPHTLRIVLIVVAVVLISAAAVFAWRWYVNKQRAAAYAKEAKT